MGTAFFGPTGGVDISGISIAWFPSRDSIVVSGWYDSCIGIEGEAVTLKDLFKRLGITKKQAMKAFENKCESPSSSAPTGSNGAIQ